LSSRYISDRFLPDKAIDLIDEAAAKLRMERDSVPEEIDELMRKIQQLEIEREAIRRENDDKKEQQLTEEINALKVKEYEMRQQWEAEKGVANKIQQDKEQIEKLKLEAQQAERDGNYARVAEIRYGILQKLEEDIKKLESQGTETAVPSDSKMVRDEVTADDIAEVVSRWTGIPVSRMLQSEREKLLHIEEELHQRVVGQQEGIDAVANAIRRSRAGLQDAKRPIASFLFLGSTGVGKTELAKALAEYLFNDEGMMTRIDMSEYQEKHTVSRLIGAPPGYIGYDEGGQLTEAVRRKPYSVVLFDEIEKAHPDVFNTLLQVLDDGRLTDNKGRTVNFKNTIIIMTSNLGSHLINDYYEEIAKKPDMSDCAKEERRNTLKEEILTMLKQNVRPEFLNRIDETILFERLNKNEVREVVELQITKLYRLLKEQEIELRVMPEAIDFLAEKGYDPEFGARPVKRAIQHHLLNQLSKDILAGKVNTHEPILVKVADNKLIFKK
ncbi:MAG: AAA family ATPase, partial [Bacteroidaceae bacterium]|nr:AAA family ATPase [Bacteroidaceae bacterium]